MNMSFRGYKASEKSRCPCGRFQTGTNPECENCGLLAKCHCGEYRKVVSVMESSYRVECECTGASTGKATVEK